jgi:hypothetical protein
MRRGVRAEVEANARERFRSWIVHAVKGTVSYNQLYLIVGRS